MRRVVADLDSVADVVGATVAEFFPRQVMHLQQLLSGFPLLRASGSPPAAGSPDTYLPAVLVALRCGRRCRLGGVDERRAV